MAEELVRKANNDRLKTLCVRPGYIMGPGDLFCASISSDFSMVRIAPFDYTQAYISVDSLCAVLINGWEALRNNPEKCAGKFYYVSDGDLPLVQMLQIYKQTHEKMKVIDLRSFTPILIIISQILDCITGGKKNWQLLQLTRMSLAYGAVDVFVDSSAAQRELNFKPVNIQLVASQLQGYLSKKLK